MERSVMPERRRAAHEPQATDDLNGVIRRFNVEECGGEVGGLRARALIRVAFGKGPHFLDRCAGRRDAASTAP